MYHPTSLDLMSISAKGAMHPIDDPRPEDDVRQELQTRHSH
jgi:hypothetical protein